MRLINKIKQSLCNHYFIFDDNLSRQNERRLTAYGFKCTKCGMKIVFKSAVLGKSIDNTFVELANLKQDYLWMVEKYEPEHYSEVQQNLWGLK